jgi:hypothetical protein
VGKRTPIDLSGVVPSSLLEKVNSWRPGGPCVPLNNVESRRLIKHNVVIDANGCWTWKVKTDAKGYGVLPSRLRRAMGLRSAGVHVAAYTLWKKVPDVGMCVCHKCDAPPCCNPKHLWEGTNLENVQDSVRKGRRFRHTEATKAKLRELNLGPNSPVYGRHHTESAKSRIRAAKLGINNPNFGKVYASEESAKYSAALKAAYARRKASTGPVE